MKSLDNPRQRQTQPEADLYKNFKELTRRLLSVPKDEIDKAAKHLPPQKVKRKPIKKPKSE